MKAILFEYCIIHQPTETKDSQGNDTTPAAEILVKPDTMLCKSEQECLIKAGRQVPEKYLDKLHEVEISIRPFAA